MRPWMHPWAALYIVQIAIGMLVWSLLYQGSLVAGLVSGSIFGALAWLFWRSKPLFNNPAD